MLFFLYQKLSNVVYPKCVVSKQESSLIFLKCDKRTYTDAMTLKKCSAYNSYKYTHLNTKVNLDLCLSTKHIKI